MAETLATQTGQFPLIKRVMQTNRCMTLSSVSGSSSAFVLRLVRGPNPVRVWTCSPPISLPAYTRLGPLHSIEEKNELPAP